MDFEISYNLSNECKIIPASAFPLYPSFVLTPKTFLAISIFSIFYEIWSDSLLTAAHSIIGDAEAHDFMKQHVNKI